MFIMRKDLSIVLCGQAGQGIQTVEYLLTRIFKLAGYNVFATKEYMSRVRGGINSTEIRVSSGPVCAYINRIDILIPLNKGAVGHVEKRISPQTIILAEKETIAEDFDQTRHKFIDVPFTKKATEIGNKIYSNVVAVGTVTGLFGIELQTVSEYVKKFFSSKADDVVQKNLAAVKEGFNLGLGLADSSKIKFDINDDADIKDQILVNGAEAVALGAIAGGCNFISSYPMSPSTGVLIFLAKQAKDFGIIAEQAEDEIAAINMAIGAWYAGARAMVTTSGGGFALMTEGLSLAGILESPIVIHLAQRPGPATGLPTRTEQADLELALYAGHGEFPRILLAPGKIQDGFYLTRKAFDLAEKYQIPVFILTDQYFVDSYYNTACPDLSDVSIEKHIVQTDADYKRYKLTDDGISPRGIPGYGKGLVAVDSDEHDEAGHITEDLGLRVEMVDKRLKKLELLKDESIPPELVGSEDYKNLIVCWGSTYNIVREAVKNLGRDDTAFLHFKQVYPLPGQTSDYLKKARRIIIVENNATSQFAKLIKLHTGIEISDRILKYDGLSFYVEELAEKLNDLLK
ncbi:MAG: 2-oxoacid:acceptor oxidoreductase subunit alpha [Planctomycetes bacterium]|nr:2-oxoacid:acceptor oxidoreductase subunit alpha [Planctomycetota bacterium]MBL7144899.1 2-oxoacid:acceptor oxidoreductase subunit alpha [Phycisphaerae bacterium]